MVSDEKANAINRTRYERYSPALRCDSSLHKGRSFGPRRGSSGRTQSRPKIINAARETRGPHGTPTKHGALSGPLGRNNKQISTPDIIDVRELETWDITRIYGTTFWLPL
ncbi:uncharacterized protein TM35_000211010 [Trypanosoma theileri]|uniref:Uncharacterized protein n=1 Tax=Trypanosoma theileri TaxID=67003 RepID=A0A1X0NS12_9TRYP|nr:uncharacterized protein TM35_000211010 [Trypanosoma theileri]ORC87495.1 hypothetical protein TM35_000211010 [Trypanosoma theileri]